MLLYSSPNVNYIHRMKVMMSSLKIVVKFYFFCFLLNFIAFKRIYVLEILNLLLQRKDVFLFPSSKIRMFDPLLVTRHRNLTESCIDGGNFV